MKYLDDEGLLGNPCDYPELNKNKGYHTALLTKEDRVKETFNGYSLFDGDGLSLLDWGCSSGHTSLKIAQNTNLNVIGIDMFHSNIVKARSNDKEGLVKYVSGDGYNYFQKRGIVFDYVLSMNNLCYLLDEGNVDDIFLSMDKLVKEGGKFILAGTDSFGEGYLSMGKYVLLDKVDGDLKVDSVKSQIFNSPRSPIEKSLKLVSDRFG